MAELQVLDGGNEQIVALRMPRALLASLDQEVAKLNAQYPGVRVTRSALVRLAIHRLLTAAAAPAAPGDPAAVRLLDAV